MQGGLSAQRGRLSECRGRPSAHRGLLSEHGRLPSEYRAPLLVTPTASVALRTEALVAICESLGIPRESLGTPREAVRSRRAFLAAICDSVGTKSGSRRTSTDAVRTARGAVDGAGASVGASSGRLGRSRGALGVWAEARVRREGLFGVSRRGWDRRRELRATGFLALPFEEPQHRRELRLDLGEPRLLHLGVDLPPAVVIVVRRSHTPDRSRRARGVDPFGQAANLAVLTMRPRRLQGSRSRVLRRLLPSTVGR